MGAKQRARWAVVLAAALPGCAAPPRPAALDAPEVPLERPSPYRSGVVDQAIRETHERQLIRDLWRAKRDAR